MRTKSPKPKQGMARLMELAGTKKNKLIAACTLSALSSAARIVPFFTVYAVIQELLKHYTRLSAVNMALVYQITGLTLAAALVFGVCSFISSILAHGAAYDIRQHGNTVLLRDSF